MLLDSFQGVNRLFVLAFDNTGNGNNKVERDSHRKYFSPRVNITNYNVLINGRNFSDQPINDQIKKYGEIRKIATGKGDDYTTGCLLDYQYFRKIKGNCITILQRNRKSSVRTYKWLNTTQ